MDYGMRGLVLRESTYLIVMYEDGYSLKASMELLCWMGKFPAVNGG